MGLWRTINAIQTRIRAAWLRTTIQTLIRAAWLRTTLYSRMCHEPQTFMHMTPP